MHFRNELIKYTDMKNNVPPKLKVDWESTVYKWTYDTFGKGLAHEIGHCFGLGHETPICNIMNNTGGATRHFLNQRQINRIRKAIETTNLKRFVVN